MILLWSVIFSIITPGFSVTWSSEIILICIFAAQDAFLIIINDTNICAASYFVETGTFFFLPFFHLVNRKNNLFWI